METIRERTKRFALSIIKFSNGLPKSTSSFVIAKQIIRAATSVGANYRSALRARSKAEFIAKLGIVEEEADESIYWLELLLESNISNSERTKALILEGNELLSIIVSSLKNGQIKSSLALLRTSYFSLCTSPFALLPSPFVLRPLPLVPGP